MRKKVFIAGSMLALLLVLGSGVAFAQSSESRTNRAQPAPRSSGGLAAVAAKLNLSSDDIDDIKREIASGESVKSVLSNHDITLDQIRDAVGSLSKHHHRLSNTELADMAKKLGLDPEAIQEDVESGKSFREIVREHSIDPERVREAISEYSEE